MHVFIRPDKNETLWQMLAELNLGIYLGNITRKPTAFFLVSVYIELRRARTGTSRGTGHGYRLKEW